MSIIKTEIKANIFLELTEEEAGALQAICGYGPKIFIEWFHRTHGKYYLEPYKGHLTSLFEKARKLSYAIEQLNKAKKVISIIKTD